MFRVTTSTTTATDPHPVMVNSLAFSHDGTTLAIGDIDGTIALINVEAKSVIATVHDPGGKGVESVAFSPDDAVLAVADANGSTYLWRVATRKIFATLINPGGRGVTSVAFSPDGKILATGDEDGSANLWQGNFRLSILVINVMPCNQGVMFNDDHRCNRLLTDSNITVSGLVFTGRLGNRKG
jgi:WD40 repeat protein